MGHVVRRTVLGSAALIGATSLGIATGSGIAALAGLAVASAVVFRRPFLVRDRRGTLAPFDPADPWQFSNLVRDFVLSVDAMLVLAALLAVAWALAESLG